MADRTPQENLRERERERVCTCIRFTDNVSTTTVDVCLHSGLSVTSTNITQTLHTISRPDQRHDTQCTLQ